MKYIKMLGLAAVAAMAITAFAGAASASASELCSTNTSPCTGTKYGAGTTLEATSTSSVLTTSGGFINPVVTCTHSALKGSVTNAGGKGLNVVGTINSLTFTGCTYSGGKCTMTATGTSYLATGIATGGGNGILTVEKDTGGVPGASVSCEGLLTCDYSSSDISFSLTGGNPAKIVANKVLLSGGAFPCPTQASWTATWTVLKPSPLFLV
jgi:hypothetical protein